MLYSGPSGTDEKIAFGSSSHNLHILTGSGARQTQDTAPYITSIFPRKSFPNRTMGQQRSETRLFVYLSLSLSDWSLTSDSSIASPHGVPDKIEWNK